MLADKVLIIELFAVDGFAARALHHDQSIVSSLAFKFYSKGFSYAHHVDWRNKSLHDPERCTYITPREIPTLEHESRNNPMESTTLVTKPLLSRAKSAEVLSGLRYNIAVELEHDSSWRACAVQGFRAELS